MKKNVNNYAKEVIKARMLQNAAKLWGVNNPNALDPFVTLLIDAFSTEIFKINNDIESIKGHMLEKLARLLTPSIYTYPRPAHAIAITHPNESKEVLVSQQEFFIKKTFTSNVKTVSDIKVDISFTAVDCIDLVKGKVCYQLIGDTIWEYDAYYNRIPILKLKQAIKKKQLFLAVDLTRYDLEYMPERFSLYCDNPTYENLEFVYKLLPFSTVSTKGNVLEVTSGLSYADKAKKTRDETLFEDYSIEKQIQEAIKMDYANKFIELKGFKRKKDDLELKVLPVELEFLMEDEQVKQLIDGRQLLWIQVDFPVQYAQEIIEGFAFYLNAFPIYNRGWRHNKSSLDIMGNTIPLVTEVGEEFLYVYSIRDSHGRIYSEVPFTENNSLQGLYTIRKGGMERFSERNAIDLIAHVIELTRDEVSAFSSLDRDKVIEALRKMIYQMRVLDQKVKTVDSSVARDVYYVILESISQTEQVEVSYWITHCTLANNIRKGVQLTQKDKVYANVSRPIILLSTTQGGEEEKKSTDAIQAYRYALTTRDKIISKEDIKNYCKMVLQDHCKAVNVYKGIKVSDNPKEGFIRTVTVEIWVNAYEDLGSQYWLDYACSLKKQISNRSIDGIEYVIQFQDENKTKKDRV